MKNSYFFLSVLTCLNLFTGMSWAGERCRDEDRIVQSYCICESTDQATTLVRMSLRESGEIIRANITAWRADENAWHREREDVVACRYEKRANPFCN